MSAFDFHLSMLVDNIQPRPAAGFTVRCLVMDRNQRALAAAGRQFDFHAPSERVSTEIRVKVPEDVAHTAVQYRCQLGSIVDQYLVFASVGERLTQEQLDAAAGAGSAEVRNVQELYYRFPDGPQLRTTHFRFQPQLLLNDIPPDLLAVEVACELFDRDRVRIGTRHGITVEIDGRHAIRERVTVVVPVTSSGPDDIEGGKIHYTCLLGKLTRREEGSFELDPPPTLQGEISAASVRRAFTLPVGLTVPMGILGHVFP